MKVKVIGIQGYSYDTRAGEHKDGVTLNCLSSDPYNEDDYRGNFRVGYAMESVFVGKQLRDKYSLGYLGELVGKYAELVYERQIGQRYETLVEINPCD